MILTHILTFQTKGNPDIIDLTSEVAGALKNSQLTAGTVTVFVRHTTVGISIIELESGLLEDFAEFWSRISPADLTYAHNRDGTEDNGYSHVRATTLGPSIVVPFVDGAMVLGTWQSIVLADFDTRPRSREVVLQFMGE